MLKITVLNSKQRSETLHDTGPFEFGRGPRREVERVVIVDDTFVSRDQMRIEAIPGGRLRVENLSAKNPLRLDDGSTIDHAVPREIELPARVLVGHTAVVIAIVPDRPDPTGFEHTLFQRVAAAAKGSNFNSLMVLGEAPPAMMLTYWFETLLTVQQSAAGTSEFYQATARALVDLIGLDRGIVVLLRNEQWQIVAQHSAEGREQKSFSRTILEQVRMERQTLYQAPHSSDQASLNLLEAIVAAAIIGPNGQFLGAVYGSRDMRSMFRGSGIHSLEAQVVQLLAAIVSTGLVRLQHEIDAAEARTRFEQFCSPELASELQRNPALLEGAEREVTILFTDLRAFAPLSERLAIGPLYRLMGDLMDRLTNCVIRHGGVIVDYYGDGLCAMWNAPDEQPDHADRACAAAIDMHAEMPDFNRQWGELAGTSLEIGVGINSGLTQVGNMGGQRRLKYGPRGHAVNLAGRVEGATKQLGVRILLTGETRQRLQQPFALRRLCQIRLVGIAGSVGLYELHLDHRDEAWQARCRRYEQALAKYEQGEFDAARQLMEAALSDAAAAADRPLLLLHRRVVAQLADPGAVIGPIFSLESK